MLWPAHVRLAEYLSLPCCVQLVQIYTRGMLPGLWPYIWSCVIMKVGAREYANVAPQMSIRSSGPGQGHTSLHLQRPVPRVASAASAQQLLRLTKVIMASITTVTVKLARQGPKLQAPACGLCRVPALMSAPTTMVAGTACRQVALILRC